MDEGKTSQTADESNRAEGGSNVNVIRLIGVDKPFFSAVAIAISLAAMVFAFFAFQELSACEYWLSRNEAFLEQLATQGVKVPDDLLRHKEK